MEYFIVDMGYMWDSILDILKEKAAQGVEVRFMYDGMNSLTNLPYNYYKTLRKYGIKAKVFSQIIPALSTVQNNRDHRKLRLLMERLPLPVALISQMNTSTRKCVLVTGKTQRL